MVTVKMLLHGFTVASDQGSFAFCGITLIRGAKNTIVDAAHLGRRELIRAKLAEQGLTPADIDYVFLTHAHWDHSQNIDMFPNAKVLIHPKELEYCRQPQEADWATPKWTIDMLQSTSLQEVSEGDEIDDGVTVLETPGHSRGAMSLLVRQGDATLSVCGDALPTRGAVTSGMPRIVFWSVDQAKSSIRKLLDRATGFYPGHDRPFEVQDGGATRYLEKTSIHVFGWPAGDDTEGPVGITYAAETLSAATIVADNKE